MAISGGNQLLDAKQILNHAAIQPGMRIADLGCGGAGHFVIPAARMVGDSGIVFAADILKSVLQKIEGLARTDGLTNIKTIWTNLEIFQATKIQDNSLDRALLINILFQTDKHPEVIKESVRMIAPGGKLIVIDWKTLDVPFAPQAKMTVNPQVIKDAAQQNGMKLSEEFEAGPYHFGLVFDKE